MDPRIWYKVAALSGVAALGLGAYGTHYFKPQDPSYKKVWQGASLYHLVYSVVMLRAPTAKKPHAFGGLLAIGIVAFSGSYYTAALLEDRKFTKKTVPLAGCALCAGFAL